MKKYLLVCFVIFSTVPMLSQQNTVKSPDGRLILKVAVKNDMPYYTIDYNGITMLEDSPLGLITSVGDFSKALQISSAKEGKIDEEFGLNKWQTWVELDNLKNIDVRPRELTDILLKDFQQGFIRSGVYVGDIE